MSGHSKWANIKHKKAAADAKKGKVFSRLAREILVAARAGGDPATNLALRSLVQKARAGNMPADNIERAIQKGTGELAGEALEEKLYEGFGPGGVQIVVQTLTDNANRTTAEIRTVFNKNGANLAQGVLRNFRRRGRVTVPADRAGEDRLLELALEAGAEDMESGEGAFVILTDPAAVNEVAEALRAAGVEPEGSEVAMVPEAWTNVSDKATASAILRIADALDDLDDVQNVFTNMDVDDALLGELNGE